MMFSRKSIARSTPSSCTPSMDSSAAFMRADGRGTRLQSLFLEISKREVLAGRVFRRISTPSDSMAAISARMISRAAGISGHAKHQHSPPDCEPRKPSGKSHQRQFVRAGQTRRTSTTTASCVRRQCPHCGTARIAQFGIDASQVEMVRLDAEFFHRQTVSMRELIWRRRARHAGISLRTARHRHGADGGERIGNAGNDVGVLVTSLGDGLHVTAGIVSTGQPSRQRTCRVK